MFDPENQLDLNRLAIAIENSRWRLQPMRQHRMQMLREFVGFHYSWSGSQTRVPLNLIQLYHNIMLRQLVARAPRAMCSARDPQLKPIAADMQAWMDKASEGMHLAESLRQWVSGALFGLGIMKVGEAMAGSIEVQGTTQYFGQPFAEPVDFDDFVFDITAKRFDQIQFCGNRYRVPLDEARSQPDFDKKARDRLMPQSRYAIHERGDARTTTLSQGTTQQQDEYQDHCELWDIWLPKEKLVIVMPYSEATSGGFEGTTPLKVIKWEGPPDGPFILLSYCDVLNNVMPAAPIPNLFDLHLAVNIGYRKLIRQMERQKTLLGVMGSASDDATRINNSSDGDTVRVDFPDRAKELSTGGMKQENIISVEQLRQQFYQQAGNLDALGGLSPQSGTLGQDEMLKSSSSTQVSEMQDRTTTGTQKVYKALAYWWWKNPILTYSATRHVAGVDIPVNITPQMRQKPFEELVFEIDVFSMQHDTPQTRLALLMQFFQTAVLPALPMIQQQGGQINWQAFFATVSKYGNFPDLEEILKWGPPPDMKGPMQQAGQMLQGGQEPPTMPPVTTRRNVRINRPGMTDQGHSQVMQMLAAGGAQPRQMAGVGGPNG